MISLHNYSITFQGSTQKALDALTKAAAEELQKRTGLGLSEADITSVFTAEVKFTAKGKAGETNRGTSNKSPEDAAKQARHVGPVY